MSESSATTTGPDRFLIAIVAGAVALILVGIGVVLVAGRGPGPAPPDPGSPVGVVQAYVEALRSDDSERAQSYLSRSAREALAQDRNVPRPPFRPSRPANVEQRVLIEPIREGPDTAEVKVTISRFSAQATPFSTSTTHTELTINLVKEDGAWRISQPVEPYQFWF